MEVLLLDGRPEKCSDLSGGEVKVDLERQGSYDYVKVLSVLRSGPRD